VSSKNSKTCKTRKKTQAAHRQPGLAWRAFYTSMMLLSNVENLQEQRPKPRQCGLLLLGTPDHHLFAKWQTQHRAIHPPSLAPSGTEYWWSPEQRTQLALQWQNRLSVTLERQQNPPKLNKLRQPTHNKF
jgi:hypothetical protein